MEIAWMVGLALVVSGPLLGYFSAQAWAEAQGLRLRTETTPGSRRVPAGLRSRAQTR